MPVLDDGCDFLGGPAPELRKEVERFALDFNAFLHSPRDRFVHHPKGELHGIYRWLAWGARIVGAALVLIGIAALVQRFRRGNA